MQAKDPRLSTHAEPPRQHLASPWTLLGIAVAVAVTLVLIFPGRGLMMQSVPDDRDRAAQAPTGGWTSPPSELEQKVRKDPQNAQLRFAFAKEQTQTGRHAQARAALEPLYNSPDPAVRQRARLEDLKIQIKQMYDLKPGSPERERALGRLRQELGAMTQYQWDAAGLHELSDIAGQLGARRARADLQMRIARSDQTLTRPGFDRAAKTALSDGQYLTAAEIYFLAQQRAGSIEEQRYYFMQAMRAYQAGNMVRDGLLAADIHMRGLANDDQTLHFMIGLARGANDLKRAQAYTRRLMRMGAADGMVRRWLEALMTLAVGEAVAAERESPPPGKPGAMRPYDAANYQLAYDVFLAAGNHQDAIRVAQAAVAAVPNDMRWRERLARVTEFAGRTGEALDQWLYIARQTGSREAWQAVLRIAPGAGRDEVLLEAMQNQAAGGRPLTDAQYQAIAYAYERIGRSQEAIDFLEKEYARNPRPAILESLAFLYERTGNMAGAITAQQRLLTMVPPTNERVTTLATMLIANGNYREAAELLQRHRALAAPDDVEYMRMIGDLALKLQDERTAQATYERLVAHPKGNLDDFVRLVNLMAPRQPEAAARLAETAYLRYGSPVMLITALNLYGSKLDWPAMRRLLAKVPPEQEQELAATNPAFLILRADYRAMTGSPKLAEEDYRAALKLDPPNRYARIGLTFLLINQLELAKLRAEMPAAMKMAETDSEMHAVLGSAWIALDEPERALPYLARKIKSNPNDYLWILNYADALERAGQADMAWRVRRHAWLVVRQAEEEKRRPPIEILQSQARIAAHLFPGDPGLGLIRNLLRADAERAAAQLDPEDQKLDLATKELVVGWALSAEQLIQARAWLWTQYGRRLAQPAWAEVPLALINKDYDTALKVLDTAFEKIPRYDRHQALRDTQQYRLAQDVAFLELERKPYDDEMHLRLTQSVMDMPSHWQTGYTAFRRGPIKGHELMGEVAVWSSPRLRLSFDVSHFDQGLISYTALAAVPANDTVHTFTALWRHAIGETRISLFHRQSLADNTGFRLTHQRPLGPRVTTRIGLAANERTLETAALAAGGMRDQVFADVQYIIAKREFVSGHFYANRYYTQDERTKIGSSYGLLWEAGHRFRTEYPDLHVRAAGSFNRFSRSGMGDAATAALNPAGTIPAASFFLPPNFDVYGIYTGFGTYYRENYTRAWRPFLDIGVMHNTVSGNGYAGLIGMSGSVIGADRFTVYASTGRGGTGLNERSREIGLRYMYMFD